jgi:hypothetical protein
MIGRILFGFCSISTTLIMLVMMVFFRSLPKLMRLFLQLIRHILYLSYLIYRALLAWLNSRTKYETRIDLLNNPHRTGVCILISLLLYALFVMILGKSFSGWMLGCAVLHGFLVGYLWKNFFEPSGLNLGESLW